MSLRHHSSRRIATRNGKPAHLNPPERIKAAVPMSEWRKRHQPMDYDEPGLLRRIFRRQA